MYLLPHENTSRRSGDIHEYSLRLFDSNCTVKHATPPDLIPNPKIAIHPKSPFPDSSPFWKYEGLGANLKGCKQDASNEFLVNELTGPKSRLICNKQILPFRLRGLIRRKHEQ